MTQKLRQLFQTFSSSASRGIHVFLFDMFHVFDECKVFNLFAQPQQEAKQGFDFHDVNMLDNYCPIQKA